MDTITTETETSNFEPRTSNLSSPPRSAAHATQRRFNIPGDTVRQATRDLPQEQRDALLWLHSYGYDHNLPYEDIAAKLKQPDGKPYDRHTVWSVLTGRHKAGKENFVKAVLDFKRLVEARATITRLGFVETTLAKKIFDICDGALVYQRINLIFGETQIGKTTALEEFALRHNHCQTTYVRLPARGGYRDCLHEFARVLRISIQSENVRARIMASFDSQKLLLVDEVHQPFLRAASGGIGIIEFIRELWDRSKCGVVLCGTNLLDHEFTRGSLKGVLEQISQRRLVTLRLPAKPPLKDLNIIARALGLDPAADEARTLQTEIIRESGLGRWMTILQAASRLADKRKQPLSWDHVIKAHAAFLKLEDPNQE